MEKVTCRDVEKELRNTIYFKQTKLPIIQVETINKQNKNKRIKYWLTEDKKTIEQKKPSSAEGKKDSRSQQRGIQIMDYLL